MRVLVAGGSGVIGRQLVPKLALTNRLRNEGARHLVDAATEAGARCGVGSLPGPDGRRQGALARTGVGGQAGSR